jgi:hypothetical protein
MTTSIYPDLNSKIQSILESIAEIKSIYAYPASQIDSYPAAIYYPATMENSFESTRDNFKIYGYKLWITVNSGNTDVQTVFSSVMPKVMDAVLAKFDAEWGFSSINGHRVWGKVETGSWSVSEEQAGIEITAEINLSIKMLTSN